MRIVVGLSGGVDSALAAALLQERGFDVVGCFLKVAIDGAPCPWAEDLPMAHRVAAYLNIPLIVRDVSEEYEREVLVPMIAAYRRGETPNPDVTCNRYVKFDALAAVAREVGAARTATGHYARIVHPNVIARPEAERLPRRATPRNDITLWRGVDHVKDQSYFLWMLTQEQLAMCEFPIGEWRKEDVRAEAKRRGFPNWDRESTSGVCFLGQVNLAEFLTASPLSLRGREGARSQLLGFEPFETGGVMPRNEAAEHRVWRSNPGTEGTTAPATVVTTSGEVIGTIPNPEALTVGQRAPIAGQPSPRYVVATEPAEQRVVVSTTPEDPARYTSIIRTHAPHWIGEPSTLPLRCSVRIRHRQDPVSCVVSLRGSPSDRSNPVLHITLPTPLTGVAPGQAVVLTDGDRVLGGAMIARPFHSGDFLRTLRKDAHADWPRLLRSPALPRNDTYGMDCATGTRDLPPFLQGTGACDHSVRVAHPGE